MQYTVKDLSDRIVDKVTRNSGRTISEATGSDMFKATALVVRDLMVESKAIKAPDSGDQRQVHYLSLEFLMGRSLQKNAHNLGILPELKAALDSLGFPASDLFELEPDAGLGNGGLGRLAACYMDSMATLEIPATGYSICYDLGIFKQKIIDGQQVEMADHWRDLGDSWLISHPDEAEEIMFNGEVQEWLDENGRHHVEYSDCTSVLAVPMDMMISGFKTEQTNILRLWDAKTTAPVDMSLYSQGEYLKAVEQQAMAEVISKVLYPEDNHMEGKSLRLRQQYFFVSATVQSIFRKHKAKYGTLRDFHKKHVIQINDTHPALVIPEMMRLLLDQEDYTWDDAWEIVTHTVAYTNHTVLPEALECWPQQLVQQLLPRIWLIIDEISKRYQDHLNRVFQGDQEKVSRNAIVWDEEVHMANLCVCACFAVNGVSALHSEILRTEIFPDISRLEPEKFKNVTNGIDHRRWISEANPKLDQLIRDCTGSDDYLLHPELLAKLENFTEDSSVLKRLQQIKADNKAAFASYVARTSDVRLNTDAMFDVQVKRLHEYKRQLLNVMHITYLYLQLKENPHFSFTPRVFLFGAKAAPGYTVAKEIIHLINSLAHQIDHDPVCKDRLQVVFLEDYRVSLAEKLMPASELSEQISTAGKEASGTGNMKFMMNGALTIGTLDGANVEMHDRLGDDNMFLFGLTAREVEDMKGHYNPWDYYTKDEDLKAVIDTISAGFDDGVSYRDLTDRLMNGAWDSPPDQYFLLADFESYKQAHQRAGKAYEDDLLWSQMSLRNIARSGFFASDRAVAQYAADIWNVPFRTE